MGTRQPLERRARVAAVADGGALEPEEQRAPRQTLADFLSEVRARQLLAPKRPPRHPSTEADAVESQPHQPHRDLAEARSMAAAVEPLAPRVIQREQPVACRCSVAVAVAPVVDRTVPEAAQPESQAAPPDPMLEAPVERAQQRPPAQVTLAPMPPCPLSRQVVAVVVADRLATLPPQLLEATVAKVAFLVAAVVVAGQRQPAVEPQQPRGTAATAATG